MTTNGTDATSHRPPPRTWAARLAGARREAFIGREAEQALWEKALHADAGDFALLWVHGPGGIGKSSLLRRLAERARLAGRHVLWAGAQSLGPGESLRSLLEARLAGSAATELEPVQQDSVATPPQAAPGQGSRPGTGCSWVILIDSAEDLGADERWLREEFLPRLSDGCLVALASRFPPGVDWTSDAGWSVLLRRLPLRNLSAHEAAALLHARGLTGEATVKRLLEKTYGHPLALVLAADVLRARDGEEWEAPEDAPDVVHALLRRFVGQVPSPRHEQALQVAAHARVTSEALLRDIMGEPTRELYDWLQSLSFASQVEAGLVLHDIAAQAIDRDLLTRDRPAYQALHQQLRRRALQHMRRSEGEEQARWALDVAWMHRFSPIMGPMVDWARAPRIYRSRLRAADKPLIVRAARRAGGPLLEQSMGHWLEARPDAFIVLREGQDRAVGALCVPLLAAEDEAPASAACAFARAAFALSRSLGALRPGQRLLLHWPFDLQAPLHFPSPIFLHACAQACAQWYALPQLALACHFVAREDGSPSAPTAAAPTPETGSEQLLALLQAVGCERRDDVPGPRSAMAFRDHRALDVDELFDRVGVMELTGEPLPVGQVVDHVLVLAEEDFRAAARAALKSYRDLLALSQSPLLRTALGKRAEQRYGLLEPEAPADSEPALLPARALRWQLQQAAHTLKEAKDPQLLACIEHTYLSPAPTQDIAAELVGLPFSTYRRRLAAAVELVIDRLWAAETEPSSA